MTVLDPRVGTPNLDLAGELLAPWVLPMSANDTPPQKVTAQVLFNQLLFALAKYQRTHKGRDPSCIQLNAQALDTLQPTQQREWLHHTNNGWMFYDIPVLELQDQSELFILRD